MKELHRMYIKLQMDREVDPDIHYICPGGYEVNGKHFDFSMMQGGRVKGDATQVEFWLSDYDDTLGEDESTVVTDKDIEKGFDEFYIYTGEDNEEEIAPLKVMEIVFEYYDKAKDKFYDVAASKDVLCSANNCIERDRDSASLGRE